MSAEPAGTEAEVQCPGCGVTIRSRLGDQVVIAELRAQGWRPPEGLDAAGPGDHVLVTVDPGRNHGRVSIARGMVPIWSPAGLLRAGDPVEVIREEFDLTEAEARVIAALVDDFTDLDLGDDNTPPPAENSCHPEVVVVDGQQEVVHVGGREPMTDQDRAALAELVDAARRYTAACDPHIGTRQELAMAWMQAAARIPDGPEKDRLRAAIRAAQQALTPDRSGDGGTDVHFP